ncbi:hypothetical protein QAD02_012072 [Eretmocerus hayati]|uniref:Uncharacterized protein n=1 Tax=Eretmocerus hayati TaxID=131215 RepID=A0ACC2NYB6_9HYME|nr:hypothetical protein QAD02_012072 [Eretmocerus hayati]
MKRELSVHLVIVVTVCFHNDFSKPEPLQGVNVLKAKDYEFPSIVSIRYKNYGLNEYLGHICTGVAITRRHVLTAAHCVLPLTDLTEVQVSAGSASLRQASNYNIRSTITYNRWIFRRETSLEQYDHDVAVITLSTELDDKKIKPARLSVKPTESNYGSKVVVAGWGTLVDGTTPEIMRKANLVILTQQECESIISVFENKPTKLDARYLCSKNEPYALLTCGDSGSPLMKGNDIVVGISKGGNQILYSSAVPLIGSNVVPSKEDEFPSVVYLGSKHANCASERMICAGTAITKLHVLTAAHCITKTHRRDVQIFAGSRDSHLCSRYDIAMWMTYDDWIYKNKKFGRETRPENDIAAITVSREFNLALVKPAAVAFVNTPRLYGVELTVAGWGNTCDGIKPQILQAANVTVLDKNECEHEIAILENVLIEIPEHFLCATAKPFMLTAYGDSGSPLFLNNKVLVGVTKGTCPLQGYIHPNQVNIHINIKYYKSFIIFVTAGVPLKIETL